MCLSGRDSGAVQRPAPTQPQLPPELLQLAARLAQPAPSPAPTQQLDPFQTPDFSALFTRPPTPGKVGGQVPQIPGMGGRITTNPGLFMPRINRPSTPNGRPRAEAPGSASAALEAGRRTLDPAPAPPSGPTSGRASLPPHLRNPHNSPFLGSPIRGTP